MHYLFAVAFNGKMSGGMQTFELNCKHYPSKRMLPTSAGVSCLQAHPKVRWPLFLGSALSGSYESVASTVTCSFVLTTKYDPPFIVAFKGDRFSRMNIVALEERPSTVIVKLTLNSPGGKVSVEKYACKGLRDNFFFI